MHSESHICGQGLCLATRGCCGCGRSLVRALWAAVLGAVGAVYIVGVALQTSSFIDYYCEEECTLTKWQHPQFISEKDILLHLREDVLDSPQDEVLDTPSDSELEDPPWKRFGDWDLVQEAILNLFHETRGGVFVEVGAGGGLFLSLTAWLERKRGWRGLLIEPHPEAYAELRRRRKAAAVRACVSNIETSQKALLWTPYAPEDIPQTYKEAARAKSTLLQHVAKEDEDAGYLTPVQCYTLKSLAWAALGIRPQVELMVIHTMGGEYKILSTLADTDLRVVMLVIRSSTEVEKDLARENAQLLGFIPYKNISPAISDFLFFIHKRVDIVPLKKDEQA